MSILRDVAGFSPRNFICLSLLAVWLEFHAPHIPHEEQLFVALPLRSEPSSRIRALFAGQHPENGRLVDVLRPIRILLPNIFAVAGGWAVFTELRRAVLGSGFEYVQW